MWFIEGQFDDRMPDSRGQINCNQLNQLQKINVALSYTVVSSLYAFIEQVGLRVAGRMDE